MKKPIFLFVLACMSLAAFGQFTVKGKVVDAETKEPLASASVFAQNTTKGTTTDRDGEFTLALDRGGYELIFSFTGYVSTTLSVQRNDGSPLVVELRKAEKSLDEVVIQSSNEVPDGWEKYGSFFTSHFIGSTPFADSCFLMNPEVLKFFYYKRSDRLKIIATEPLQIVNRALGYNLRYELDSFVYHYKTDINSYRGLCLYAELEGTPEEMNIWKRNREEAYYGSRLHFLRSYYDSTLIQEGFTVSMLLEEGSTAFGRLTKPYDSTYYFFNDSTEEAELFFPLTVNIGYTKKAPDSSFLAQFQLPPDVQIQNSYVTLSDVIIIKPNGYFFDQRSWINQGYWSWKNIADQLPYDYSPGD